MMNKRVSDSVGPADALYQIARGFGAACVIVTLYFAVGANARTEESMNTLDDTNTAYELSKEFKAAPEIVFRSFIDERDVEKDMGSVGDQN